jgi:ribonuclease HII
MKNESNAELEILSRIMFDRSRVESASKDVVIGFDEVGLGAFAGPITVGCFLYNPFISAEAIDQLCSNYPSVMRTRDSKKLSAGARELISSELIRAGTELGIFDWALGSASAAEINEVGVTRAHDMATGRALDSLIGRTGLDISSALIIEDGNKIDPRLKKQTAIAVVKGDDLSFAVGAASIIAKVYRDTIMNDLAKGMANYNWGSNKGYGSPDHRAAIGKFGITPEHRVKYCRNYIK